MSQQPSAQEAMYIDLVEEIAAREGVSPLDLPPLYDSISAATFDALTSRDRDFFQIAFTYCGYDVTVDKKGHVAVDGEA